MSDGLGAPGSPGSLRTANQRRVVHELRSRGGDRAKLTQAELARVTGLAPATVSNIVRELSASGLVDTEPGAGRRGTSVWLARSAGLVGALDFGHSHLAVALADLTGHILGERREPLHPQHSHAEGLALADRLLDALLVECDAARSDLRQVALGLPAPITDGLVQSSAILPGWVGVDAGTAAARALGCAVVVDNDANLGALGEHRAGAARGVRSSVYIKAASGVGAGLIIEGRLFHGSGGTAGELGHLTLNEQGPVCRCGSRGCLEAYASSVAVQSMMSGQLPGSDVAAIVEHARQGNLAALRALEDAGLALGWGIASIVNLLNPDLIVVGGELAVAGELLLEPARVGLRRHAVDAVAQTPVVAAELGPRSSLIGGCLLAAEAIDLELPG